VRRRPDLSAFLARGGTLILKENMADYAQSPYAGIGYCKSMVARMGECGKSVRQVVCGGRRESRRKRRQRHDWQADSSVRRFAQQKERRSEVKGDVNPRIAAIRDYLDQTLGTFEEWVEANLRDDDSLSQTSRIRDLVEQYREAALQRKIAISAAWATGPPFTVLDELLDRTGGGTRENDELASAQAAVLGAIAAFKDAKRSNRPS
jgi:hypothetical protein